MNCRWAANRSTEVSSRCREELERGEPGSRGGGRGNDCGGRARVRSPLPQLAAPVTTLKRRSMRTSSPIPPKTSPLNVRLPFPRCDSRILRSAMVTSRRRRGLNPWDRSDRLLLSREFGVLSSVAFRCGGSNSGRLVCPMRSSWKTPIPTISGSSRSPSSRVRPEF